MGFGDPDQPSDRRTEEHADPRREMDLCVELLNGVLDGFDDLDTAIHLCRRNKARQGWVGEGGYGPRLAGTGVGDDPEALEKLLREGRGQMPPVGRDWNDAEMTAITDYLEKNVGS